MIILFGTLSQQSVNLPQQRSEFFSSVIERAIQSEDLEWLFHGCLTVEFRERGSWLVRYAIEPGLFRGVWFLEDGTTGRYSTWGGRPNGGSVSAFQAWFDGLSEDDRAAALDFFRGDRKGPSWREKPDLKLILCSPNRELGVHLEISGSHSNDSVTRREFERLLGSRLEPGHSYDGRFVFHEILRRSFVSTENVRRSPVLDAMVGQLAAQVPVDLKDGENIAVYLFRKKNGALRDRQEYQAVKALFRRITGTRFDVGLDRSHLLIPPPDAGSRTAVPLSVNVVQPSGDLPLESCGAGITEALFISTVIVGDEDRVILLDEPALNLHPATQAAAIEEIRSRSENQFFLVTHSPVMIPANGIVQMSRFSQSDGSTHRSALDPKRIGQMEIDKLQKELRGSTDTRALLFARAAILVEGETELGALPVWFDRTHARSLEQRGLAVRWVMGYPNFENYVRLLEAFAIPWVIVCDGDAFEPPPPWKDVATQMREAGVKDVPNVDGLDFARRRELLEPHGVVTLANGPKDKFESLATIKKAQKELPAYVQGRSKVRKAIWIAENRQCPPEVADLLKKVLLYIDGAQSRLPG